MKLLLSVGIKLNKMKFKNGTKKEMKLLMGYQKDLSPEGTLKLSPSESKDIELVNIDLIVFVEA